MSLLAHAVIETSPSHPTRQGCLCPRLPVPELSAGRLATFWVCTHPPLREKFRLSTGTALAGAGICADQQTTACMGLLVARVPLLRLRGAWCDASCWRGP